MQSLVLGTAQWGNTYGITNQVGRLSDWEISEIVVTAKAAGIRFIDTAAGYGDAESRLTPSSPDIGNTSKVKGEDSGSIERQVRGTLDRLQIRSLRACLIHDWSTIDMDQSHSAIFELKRMQSEGLVEKIGFSAYDEVDLVKADKSSDLIDCVQLPINVLDTRMLKSKSVLNLHAEGVEIQGRSIFLQGLLAARSDTPQGRHPEVVQFHDVCESLGIDPLAAALNFVQQIGWLDQVVIGVTSAAELTSIMKRWNSPSTDEIPLHGSQDLELIDPRLWTSR